MKSISRQLNVGVMGSLLVASVILGQTASWLLDGAMRDYMTNNLRDEAHSLLQAIKRGPNGLLLESSRIDPAYHRPLSGRYFTARINGQQWRSRSLWDEQLAPAQDQAAAPKQEQQELVDGPSQQRLLWLRADYRRYGQPVTLHVAIDYSPILQDIRRISLLMLIVWIGALLLLALLQHLLMRRALRPLDNAKHQVEQLRSGSRTTLDEQVPEELAPLVREINRMLCDTQQLLKRSRTGLGNLSHALKTPLAVLRNLAERETIRRDKSLHTAISTQLEHMRQRITRELAHARTAGTLQPENLFNTDDDVPLLLESLRRIHQHRVTIDSEITLRGAIPWEREDILELLGNLLDNACKWGRERITLQLQRADDSLVIQVDDDGTGIAEDKIPQALQRGERLDDSVVGHGLGLAIVADKVAAYDGTLTFDRSEAGGLAVRITLPWPALSFTDAQN